MENVLQAGFCSLVMQPPLGLRIPGYYTVRLAEGTADPLHLRATALACGDVKAVIFNCECIGLNVGAYEIIKKKVAEACDIDPESVYINCIHSHTSFIVVPAGEEMDDMDIHLLTIYQQFADCAKLAFQDLKPATILSAIGECKDIAFVRRFRMTDGTARTNPPYGDPNVVEPIGKPDDHVRIVRIQREGANEILMVHFGNHADMIGGKLYTPDWPGYLVRILDSVLEGKVNTMFLLGCEGDLNHRNYFNPVTHLRGVEHAKYAARMVAGAVLRIYDRAVPSVSNCLRYTHTYVKVGKNLWDPERLPEAEELVQIYREKGEFAPELNKYPGLHYREALRILANLKRPEFFNLRISGLRLGDVAFVGIPGEPFASIGLDIVERSPMPLTVVTAITNGYEGYYPDAVAFAEPGYSYEKSTSPFAPDCGEKLIGGALEVLQKLHAE